MVIEVSTLVEVCVCVPQCSLEEIVSEPGSFCLLHDYVKHQVDEFAKRKDLIARQPNE